MGSGISKSPPSYCNTLRNDPIINQILKKKASMQSIIIILDNLSWPELLNLKNKIIQFIYLHKKIDIKLFQRLTVAIEKIQNRLIAKRKHYINQERKRRLRELEISRINRLQQNSVVLNNDEEGE